MADLLTPEEIRDAVGVLPGVHLGAVGSLVTALRAPTFPDAVRLVSLVGERAEAADHHPDMDVRWRTVTFTLATHSAGGVTAQDVALAREILDLAAQVGAEPVAPSDRVELALDCVDADAIRPFWKAGLGYREQATPHGTVELHDPAGRGPVLWFQAMDPARTGRGRFHLDVYVPADRARERVDAALAAGGTLLSEEFVPSWWVLADAEGNELCVCAEVPGEAPWSGAGA